MTCCTAGVAMLRKYSLYSGKVAATSHIVKKSIVVAEKISAMDR